MNIRDQKKHLRESISQRIMHMSDKERAAESRSLCKRILEVLPPSPLTIAGYVPLKSEADILPLIKTLLERGNHVYLPVFKRNIPPSPLSSHQSREGCLTFRLCSNLSELKHGDLNIPEPLESTPELDPTTLDIALVPARAFDRKGWRLGRGNGGYDKWIRKQRASNPKTQFWGIALECQIVNEVPREEHDERVDKVITARGFVSPLS